MSSCSSDPYIEFGISREYDNIPMDDTMVQAAVGTEWLYQAKYRKLIFDLRYQHKSDPDDKYDNGLDELEFNTRFYLQ